MLTAPLALILALIPAVTLATDALPAYQKPLQQQVAATERAFAKTMADRDLAAFGHDAAGKLIGTYTSIWRLEAPRTWRVVFDSGCEVCAHCALD